MLSFALGHQDLLSSLISTVTESFLRKIIGLIFLFVTFTPAFLFKTFIALYISLETFTVSTSTFCMAFASQSNPLFWHEESINNTLIPKHNDNRTRTLDLLLMRFRISYPYQVNFATRKHRIDSFPVSITKKVDSLLILWSQANWYLDWRFRNQSLNKSVTPTPSFAPKASFIELAWLLALAYGIESFLITSETFLA